jgi:hypothetical protein
VVPCRCPNTGRRHGTAWSSLDITRNRDIFGNRITAWHSAGDNRDAQPGKLCGTVAPVSMTQPGDNKLRGQQIADQIGGNVPP